MSALRHLSSTKVTGTAGGLSDSVLQRFSELSLKQGRGSLGAMRGYARVARSRPLTPKTLTSASPTPVTPIPEVPVATSPKSTPAVPASEAMVSAKSAIKLPKNFKLAKLDTVPEYDPNMVIFLDKHGNVSMIPQDDRVTGETKAERAAVLALDPLGQGAEEEGLSTYQRGSKEMEYGRKRIGQVELPKEIQDAIRSVLDEEDKSLIRTDALRLYGSLRSTMSLDDAEYIPTPTKRLKSGSKADMRAKGEGHVTAHILEYGHRESTAYIAAMAPTTYSAIRNVLEEVRHRVPDLAPKTFFDFGTGPGTAIWAANDVWQAPIKYTGLDTSMAMLETAEDILESLSEQNKPIPDVTFKPFMSHGPKAAKYDVVMSAFALSEQTTTALRRSTVEQLWEATTDMLILIDRGTPSGFKILAEAREQILGLDTDLIKPKHRYDDFGRLLPEEVPVPREAAHVLAPCPHDSVCPMFESLARDSQWCHFSQKVQRPDFLRKTKHSKENFEDAKYTYVILRKGPRPSFKAPAPVVVAPSDTLFTSPSPSPSQSTTLTDSPEVTSLSTTPADTTQPKKAGFRTKKPPPPPPVTYDTPEDMYKGSHTWSRIVVPPLKKDGHVVMDVCAANGFLERIIIPKSQGKIPYRDARKATWGDLFPHAPKNKPVRKESVQHPFDGQDNGVDDAGQEEAGEKVGPNTRRRPRPPVMSMEQMLKRTKQKEKKQSRQKVQLDESGGEARRKKHPKGGDDDLTLEV